MSQYKLWDRLSNYSGGYGSAKKDAIMDISGNRLDQQILPLDHSHADSFRDGASSYLMSNGLQSRMRRDLALDAKNPRQELPKSEADEKMIDLIPNQIDQMIPMSHPADFEASNNVLLLQQSRVHSTDQETMFTDPKALENKNLHGDLPGRPNQGASQQEVYSFEGSAAGRQSNHLTDEDGAYLNSVESNLAF